MQNPVDAFWQIRLKSVAEQLTANNFEVFVTENAAEAKTIVLEKILPETGAKSVSWGGSMTLNVIGLCDALRSNRNLDVIDPFDKNATREEAAALRSRALSADLFLSGTNAVTQDGQLVNLDMTGNRVGAMAYGPKCVVIVVGRNKIVEDIEAAIARIKNLVAPANAMRLKKKTPCVKTSYCQECNSPERLCNTWIISEKSFPKDRVKIVLVNEDMGL